MKIQPRFNLRLLFLLICLLAVLSAWWGVKANMQHDVRLTKLYAELGNAFGQIRRGWNEDATIESLKKRISQEQGRNMGAEIQAAKERVEAEDHSAAKSGSFQNSQN